MAHHVQAEKRNRQSIRRHAANKAQTSSLRTALRKLTEAVDAGKLDEAEKLLKAAVSKLDRANTKGILKRRTSSRKVSQAVRKVAAVRKTAGK